MNAGWGTRRRRRPAGRTASTRTQKLTPPHGYGGTVAVWGKGKRGERWDDTPPHSTSFLPLVSGVCSCLPYFFYTLFLGPAATLLPSPPWRVVPEAFASSTTSSFSPRPG